MNLMMSDSELSAQIVADHFMGDRPGRYFAGDAISSNFIDCRGISFEARGLATPELPIPLLIEHRAEFPAGRVVRIDQHGDRLKFVAELCNSDRLSWAKDIWAKIRAKEVFRCSIKGTSLDPVYSKAIVFWRLQEISLVECGLD